MLIFVSSLMKQFLKIYKSTTLVMSEFFSGRHITMSILIAHLSNSSLFVGKSSAIGSEKAVTWQKQKVMRWISVL